MAIEQLPHPGLSIVENWLDPLCLSVTDAARVLGVARHTLSRVLNGHAAISPEMAIRLEKAGWSDAEYWLRRQTAFDLLQARENEDRIEVERYQPQPTLWEGQGVYRNTGIAVLLGAGASAAAGYPSTRELTGLVVSGRGVTRHSDGSFYISGRNEPCTEAVRIPAGMAGRLGAEAESNLTANAGTDVDYEDICLLAREVLDETREEMDNPAVRGFVNDLRAGMSSTAPMATEANVGGAGPIETPVSLDLEGLMRETCKYIEDVVSQSLAIHQPAPDRVRHLNAIEHACKVFNVTSLATLSHETHVETFLRDREIVLVDGFSAQQDAISLWTGNVPADVAIPFLKLRGSVDWYRYTDGRIRRVPHHLYPLRIGDEGSFVYAEHSPRVLLIGPANAVPEHGSGIFRELRYCFRSTIGQANTMVVCGYGFDDRGVNSELIDWYDGKGGRMFVIVHPEPDRLVENARGAVRKNWETWKRNDAIALIEKSFEDVEALEFVETIAKTANR